MLDCILRMKHLLLISVFLPFFAFESFAQSNSESLEKYTWVYGDTIGYFYIPKGFKQTTWQYGEGSVVNLIYPDSSKFVLHYGFTMSLPLLKSPEHLIYSQKRSNDRKIRSGRVQRTKLYWHEENFLKIPVNIAFTNTPKSKIDLYNNALKSLVVRKHLMSQ